MVRSLLVIISALLLMQQNYSAQSNFTTGITTNFQPNGCGSATLTANTLSNVWVPKTTFAGGLNCYGVNFSIGSKGYLCIGYTTANVSDNLWEYDQPTDSWTQKANFTGTLRAGAAGFSIGTKGYVGTGNDATIVTPGSVLLNDFWEYDPAANTWAQKANITMPRQAAVDLSIGGKGYIGLGFETTSAQGITDDFWEYDPATDSWSQKANFGGGPRASSTGFSIGNKGYVGLGADIDNAFYNDFWEYNPAANTWTQKTNYPGLPRIGAFGFGIFNKGYMGTGATDVDDFDDFWEYDPPTDSWTQRPNFPGGPRAGCAGFDIQCKGYVGIGRNQSFILKEDFWEYNPLVFYQWSTGATTQSIDANLSGIYTVTVTNITGCTVSASVAVNIVGPTITVNNPTVCAGSSAVLSATISPASSSYSWSTGQSTPSITVTPGNSQTYTVTASDSGCSVSAVSSVSVIPVTTAVSSFSYAPPLCKSDPVVLPVTAAGFSTGGNFSSSPPGLSLNGTSGQIDPGLSTSGSYTVNYSVPSNNCLLASSGNFVVSIQDPVQPVTNFSYTPACSSQVFASPVQSSGFSTGGLYSGTSGLTVDANTGIVNVSTLPVGTYTVTYTVGAGNCILGGSSSAIVSVVSPPVLSVSANVTIIPGSGTTLNANSSTGTYTWFPVAGLSCVNCSDPVASPSETAEYCVKTNNGICTNSLCITVSVELPCSKNYELALPNSFSPNNDGINDQFCLQGWDECVSNFSIHIYDRWGEKVFESYDPSFCWDGTYKGKTLSPSVFIYNVNALFNKDKALSKKGNITLIK